MRITQECDYALRVMLYLYQLGLDKKVEAKVIAEHEKIPNRFLLKLLRKLSIAGIIKSYRGIGGGYAIERKPETVTLYDVVEAIEGPVYLNRCLFDANACNLNRTAHCNIHMALAGVQENLINNLKGITFKDILS